ncbi:sulfakinin receptor, putative [Ixodes scapularis]|uniref:Sulfakinin receptor, putative n=1 Tax=Ixodes scapularis TaxID=6945 RepID=B7PMN3_IXOSC|nr:sulfakinin receptor, putative [Ixodes scapularis]|eukprot:XP_002435031.1 sulfakinin receptor, putative [Ixodes scapularis]
MIRKVISNIPEHTAPSPPSTTSWVFDGVNLLPNVTPTPDIVEVLTVSNITLEDSGGQDIPPEPEDVILRITLYSIIFVFAVVGNVLVLVTLVQNKRMRTVTNVFLVNLAVSDLLLGVLCMPFTLVGSLLRNFVFGEIMCRLIPYLQEGYGRQCTRTTGVNDEAY